jgi:hypothetical protein
VKPASAARVPGGNRKARRFAEGGEETGKQLRAQGDPYTAGYDDAIAQADRDIAELKKKIEFIKFLQRQEALEGRTGPQFLDARDLQANPPLKPSSGYQSKDLAAAKREAKLYTRAMQQLEEELGKLQNLSKAEIVINRVTTGSWKDLTLEHKAYLISIAGEYDDRQLPNLAAEGIRRARRERGARAGQGARNLARLSARSAGRSSKTSNSSCA